MSRGLEEIGIHMEYKEVSLAPDGDEAPTSFENSHAARIWMSEMKLL